MIEKIKEFFMEIKEEMKSIIIDVKKSALFDYECDPYEEEQVNKEKKYISRTEAIEIAKKDKNLKKSMYREAINEGVNYGIIELEEFYATLVKKDNEFAWYIKVLKARYGIKKNNKYKRGYFDDYSNIRCLINATTGKYEYMDSNYDTSNIYMADNDEFLEYLFNSNNY